MQHSTDLYNKIKHFEDLASTPNYIMLLECQIEVISQRIEEESKSGMLISTDLLKAKEHLEERLRTVKEAAKNNQPDVGCVCIKPAPRELKAVELELSCSCDMD